VWDLFHNANHVREMIKQKIQEESLRTYLFSYSCVYDSLSLSILSSMFELEKSVVHSVISKMIINEELMVRRTYCDSLYCCNQVIINNFILLSVIDACSGSYLPTIFLLISFQFIPAKS
jgi:PCI domain